MKGASIKTARKVVTQQQIAQATGLSLATVSAVLSGKASLRRIAPDTVEQVWNVSHQMGYQPPIRVNKPQSRNIGIILRKGVRYALSNPFYGDVYEGIEEVLTAEDFHPIFSNPFDNRNESSGVPRVVAQGKVAGVILLGQAEEEFVHRLCEFGVKLTAVNFESSLVPSLIIDGVQENILAMDYLQSQGHHRIAYITSGTGTQFSQGLEQGYRQALSPDVKPLVLRSSGGDMEHGHQVMSRLLETTPKEQLPFTCILAENDTLAAGAVLALQAAGLRVPDDISVMGGQDLYLPYPLPVKLTTTSIDKRYMGRMAVRLLLDSFSSEQNSQVRVTVQATLVVRESVRHI